jgi:hypothetical protein
MSSFKIRKRSIILIFFYTLAVSFIAANLNSLLETSTSWFFPFFFATAIFFTYLLALLFNRFEAITRKKSHNYVFIFIEYFFKISFLVVAFFIIHKMHYEVSVSSQYMRIFKEECFEQRGIGACLDFTQRLANEKNYVMLLELELFLCNQKRNENHCVEAAEVYLHHNNLQKDRTQELLKLMVNALRASPLNVNFLQYTAALFSLNDNFAEAIKKQEEAILNYKLRAKALNKDLRFLPLLLDQLKRYEANQAVDKKLLRKIYL